MIKLTKEELNIIRSVSIHHLLGLQNTGRKLMIKCPFHEDNTPSFLVSPDNSFHCFGKCNLHGHGAIDLCMAMGYTFQESIEELLKQDI